MATAVFILPGGCAPFLLPTGDGQDVGNAGDGADTGGDDGRADTGDGSDGAGGATGNSGLTGKYLGAQACALCHQKMHEDWSGTRHANALETLEAIGQGENAACLGCHTAGFGAAGGFVDRATTDALAGVQCENCHGPGLDHRSNVADRTLRPPVDISAAICGTCHNDAHHPTVEEWTESRHSQVRLAGLFADGRLLTSCGECHSGDFRQEYFVEDKEDTPDELLFGVDPDEMNGTVCATCHDPHRKTDNAFGAEEGHDIQLRYPQVAFPLPSDAVEDATDPARFNLCGQCHHSRGRDWTATSRGPHHSHQANMYTGEMPIPEGTESLVANERTLHAFVPKQCSTCHMQHKLFESEDEPAHTGHRFAVVDTVGCSTTGCHPSPEGAAADKTALQGEVTAALADIAIRLGDVSTWEYTSDGGPDADGQALLSDEIKQIRFLLHYVEEDGSLGIHNPEYVRAILTKAEDLLSEIGK